MIPQRPLGFGLLDYRLDDPVGVGNNFEIGIESTGANLPSGVSSKERIRFESFRSFQTLESSLR